ncbi:MAG: hypothetical protein V1886_01695 [archaeon]
MEKRGILQAVFLTVLAVVLLLNLISAEDDTLTIKFHSRGDGSNFSVDLTKYMPLMKEYYYSEVKNVTVKISQGVATVTPIQGWIGDEIITFYSNKSLKEEKEPDNLKITNLEPVVEMSFPALKAFVVSPGQIEFSVIAFDPDNDMLQVEWLVNGKVAKQERADGKITSSFVYNKTSAIIRGELLKNQKYTEAIEKYVIKVVINDSRNSKILEWHFNIVNQSCIDLWQCGNWTDCLSGKRHRECTKINPECEYDTYRPPTDWVDPVCIAKDVKCKPNWTCMDWQGCRMNYDSGVIISGMIIDAVRMKQERLCYDEQYCTGGVGLESRECNGTVPIITRRVDWCNAKYVEIFNEDTGQFISRISEYMVGETPRMDIDLSLNRLSEASYCWYCYDGKKDYDETGEDCGGSCKECIYSYAKRNFFDIFAMSMFITADILLVGFIFRTARKRIKSVKKPRI